MISEKSEKREWEGVGEPGTLRMLFLDQRHAGVRGMMRGRSGEKRKSTCTGHGRRRRCDFVVCGLSRGCGVAQN